MFHGVSIDPISGRVEDFSTYHADPIDQHWALTRTYLNRLAPVEQRVLRWLFGLDEESLSAEEIADRLNMSTDQIWRAADRGLAEIGLYTLSESSLWIEEAA